MTDKTHTLLNTSPIQPCWLRRTPIIRFFSADKHKSTWLKGMPARECGVHSREVLLPRPEVSHDQNIRTS
jgi:hypothetical protein